MIILAIAFTVFTGCKKEDQNPAGTISDFESQAHIQVGASEGESTSGDTSKAPVSGDFVVSEKKYDYKDANLVLLYVENQTNRHYNVTIKGKYLDENGETIKEETQTFEAFPAGWSNHFIFYPRTAFDRFTYSVETEEYIPDTYTSDESGTPYVSYIELSYEKNLQWIRGLEPINPEHPDNAKEVRQLLFYPIPKNSHTTKTIAFEYHLLILDTNGEIYATDFDFRDYMGVSGGLREEVYPVGKEGGDHILVVKQQERGEDETIPDTVQGVFTAIFSVISVYDYEAWLQSVIG